MADASMNLLDELRKEGSGDLVREAMRWLVHELMEAEVTAMVEAGSYERTAERTTQRNGHRSRRWDIRVATLELQIPRLRTGSYFSSWLEPRKRSEQALVAVVAEAYVQGVSTRKVEALVQSLGIAGISKSQVSCLPRAEAGRGVPLGVAGRALRTRARRRTGRLDGIGGRARGTRGQGCEKCWVSMWA